MSKDECDDEMGLPQGFSPKNGSLYMPSSIGPIDRSNVVLRIFIIALKISRGVPLLNCLLK